MRRALLATPRLFTVANQPFQRAISTKPLTPPARVAVSDDEQRRTAATLALPALNVTPTPAVSAVVDTPPPVGVVAKGKAFFKKYGCVLVSTMPLCSA